ncbi:MAG: L-serine ammonia-lyase [Hyphomicrobiales bacterium]|nr:L-serine ammonia-lyase [Hyphomicrobiales bacterium]
MFFSVFELFKIGIGPSSSHTVGPMVAARRFLDEILLGNWPRPADVEIVRLSASLHGSLAFTGKGHASDRAIVLGLAGERPDEIDPDDISNVFDRVCERKVVEPAAHPQYRFDPVQDLLFDYDTKLPGHTNGMSFSAFGEMGHLLLKRIYYSVGGGFVVSDDEMENQGNTHDSETIDIPFPFDNADQMMEMARKSGKSIAEMKRQNEICMTSPDKLRDRLHFTWSAMKSSVDRGLENTGTLPGGLLVKRRASALRDQLNEDWKSNRRNPLLANDWLQLYAMAVNEENAAGGRIVTAPTNGAAGVIPAVLCFFLKFNDNAFQIGADDKVVETYLLTAAAIGGLIKHNASISGAEVGCQGEVGSAAAMAAAGLAAVMGGTPEQIENAAEIALEHHLGMTCDPVGGLVQVPCIERNGFGAIKAVSAASLALKGDGTHFVPLDKCIETMRQTGHDMNERYKETSQGGLAVNIVEC